MDKTDQILDYLIRFKVTHDGNSPTFREIMRACDLKSTSVVSYYLHKMQVAKMINIEPGHKGIEVKGGRWTYESEE